MLYEFDFHLRLFDLFKICMFFLPMALFLFSASFNKKIVKSIIMVLSGVLTVMILLNIVIFPLYSYFQIKDQIKSGKASIVEGRVTNFYTPKTPDSGHDQESFIIDKVQFCYSGTENYGYSTFLCQGGVITGNGQNLRIAYCYDPITKDPVICSIQEIQ